MNKKCFRVIFNVARGQLMVVGELASSRDRANGISVPKLQHTPLRLFGLLTKIVSKGIAILLGTMVLVQAETQIVVDASAPSSNQATMTESASGITQVDIAAPSSGGVSRNIYTQFDIDSDGAILNNSQQATQTQLAGWIDGNGNLGNGTASIILSEVNSNDPSYLQGYLEVAGQRAELIIANPSGIQVNGGGFINASSATLTTGQPVMQGGHLDSYRVTGGKINIFGSGLDSQQSDYTQLIARAVEVNAGIWATDLSVITGENDVNAETFDVSKLSLANDSNTPVGASIDVAALGGMYAGKIRLVGTEDGVGIHNYGTIAASVGNIVITEDGELLNAGLIQAEKANIEINAATLINNADILAESKLKLRSNTLDNSDGNLQTNHFDIETENLKNTNGTLQQLGSNGLELSLTELKNNNGWVGQLLEESDEDLDLSVSDDVNESSAESTGDAPSAENIDAVVEPPTVGRIQVNNTADNQGGKIVSAGLMDLSAEDIDNQDGDLLLNSLTMEGGVLNNADGIINAQSAELSLESWNNSNGQLSSNAATAQVNALNNDDGEINVEDGLDLNIDGSFENNGTINAGKTELSVTGTLTNRGLIDGDQTYIEADILTNIGIGRIYGDYIGLQAQQLNNFSEGTIAARTWLDIGATKVDNANGSILMSLGGLSIGGSLDENYMATGSSAYVLNRSATVESYGDMDITADKLVNRDDYLEYEIYLSDSENNVRKDVNSHDYYKYDVKEYSARVTNQQQGKIISGGNLIIEGATIENRDSQILAGETLSIVGTTVTNISKSVDVTTTHSGTFEWRDEYKDCWKWTLSIICTNETRRKSDSYNKTITRSQTLNTVRTAGNTNVNLNGSVGARSSSENENPPSLASLTTSNLFQMMPDKSSGYLIQTDPAFTNYDSWLSSDFMLDALGFSDDSEFFRLGDGFYEQQLIKEQIVAQTGQRYLGDNTDDTTQYQNLMTAGVAFAQAQQLRPGIALTAAQVKALTSDIVWLVEQDVALPDGTVAQVLVPKVYTVIQAGDLDASGALLAGRNIEIDVEGEFNNTGTVQASKAASIDAQEINLTGGDIAAGQVQLSADEDINIIGASVQAEDLLSLDAGNDLNVITTTAQGNGTYERQFDSDLAIEDELLARLKQNVQPGSSTSLSIDQYASLSVANGTGKIVATAGNDINLTGALIDSAGDIEIDAENDLNLNAITESSSDTVNANISFEERHDVGVQITSGGNINLNAGNDISATAANVEAGKGLNVVAEEGSVEILAGVNYSASSKTTSYSNGLLGPSGSNTTESRSEQAIGSSFSAADGNMVIQANEQVTIQASDVSASDTLQVAAADIVITAAVNETYNRETSENEGAFKKTTTDEGSMSQTAASSSLNGGNIQLQADNSVHITASDLDAKNNLMIGNLEVQQNEDGSFEAINGEGTPDQLIVDSLTLENEDWKHETEELKGIAKLAAVSVAAVGGYFDDDFEVSIESSSSEENHSTTQQGSSLNAGGNIVLAAQEQIDFVASDMTTEGSAIISADNVHVLSAEETSVSTTSESETTAAGTGVDYHKDDAELSIGGLEYTEETVTQKETSTTHAGSNISAGNLIMLADEDINILASSIEVSGQAVLQAEEDVVVGGHQAIMTNETDTKTETTTINVGVRNAYVDTADTLRATNAANKSFERAQRDFNEAEERVAAGELDEAALDDYRVNLAATASAVVKAEMAFAASVASSAAGAMSGGTGFYLTGSAETTQTSSHSESTQGVWQGSTISAGSLSVSGENATFQGSDIMAGIASLNSTNTLITAGENTSSSSSTSNSVTASANFTLKANDGLSMNGSVGANSSENDSTSTQYVNSRFNVGSLTSDSENLTLRGAEVTAQTANLTVGNLTVESLQDTYSSTNSSVGVNVGFSDSNALSSLGGNVGGGVSKGEQVNSQSRLLIAEGEDSQITADSTTLIGGMVANASYNEDGVLEDHGNLNLSTGELNVSTLEDSSYSQQTGFGLTFNLNKTENATTGQSDNKISSTTVTANNSGHEMAGSTQATLGNGNIQVGGVALDDSDAAGVNQNLADAQITTLDIDTGGLNANITVDSSMLTVEGWEKVIDDHKNLVGNTVVVAAAAATDVAAVAAAAGSTLDVVSGEGIGQAANAFNTTINGKDLAYAQGGEIAGMTEAMREGEVENAEAFQEGLNDIDQILSGTEEDRARVVDGVTNTEGDGVYGAAQINGDTMFVGMDEGNTDSVVNTVAHESMHLGGAGEASAHTTGFLTDLAYRANAYANKDAIADNAPDADYISVQDPAANAALLASNNALFRVLDDQGDLNYRAFDEAEAGMLDSARIAITSSMVLLPEVKQEALGSLNAVACAEVRCAAGVSEKDPYYDTLKELQDAGDELISEGANIHGTLHALGVETETSFGYGFGDSLNDTVNSHENVVSAAGDLGDTIGGAGTIVAGYALAGGGCYASAGFGCVAAVAGGSYISAEGSMQMYAGAESLTAPHDYMAGDQVVGNFTQATYSDEFNPGRDLAIDLAYVGAEVGIGVVASKTFDTLESGYDAGWSVVKNADVDVPDSSIGIPYSRSSDSLSPVLDFDAHGNEILYRSVPETHLDHLESDGVLLPTTETSVAALDRYADSYDGILVKFTLKPGTSDQLQDIGIVAPGKASDVLPNLSMNSVDWMQQNARFKVEGVRRVGVPQMTTQLGQGKALDIFNSNIIDFDPWTLE